MTKGIMNYRLSWNDWNGGHFSRSFVSKEERDKFIPRIKKTDKKGNVNYHTWETDDIYLNI